MVLQAISSPDFEWVRQATEGPPVSRFGLRQPPRRSDERTQPFKHRLPRSLIFEIGNSASSQRVMPRTRDQGEDKVKRELSEPQQEGQKQQEESAPAAKREDSSQEEEDRKPAARESPRFSLSYSEEEEDHNICPPEHPIAVLDTDGIGVLPARAAEEYLAAHTGYHDPWQEATFATEVPLVPYAALPSSETQLPYFDPSIPPPEAAAAIHPPPDESDEADDVSGTHRALDYGYGYAGVPQEPRDVSAAFQAFRPPTQAKPPPPARAKRPTAKRKTTTKRGKKTRIPLIEPTEKERAEANTGRAKSALKIWYGRLNELAQYKAVHGHTNVRQKDPQHPQLGIWVNKQRMEKKFMDDHKQSSMTADRVAALERIGFTWAKRKGDYAWNKKFGELQDFKEAHHHVNVPTKYDMNKALGRWVSTQRSQAKLFLQGQPSHMTQERYESLCSIGFNFDMSNRKEDSSDPE